MTNETQPIISGESQIRYGTTICAIARYLTDGAGTSTLDKTDKHFKREETERLKTYIDNQNLWVKDIDLNNYISEGAEQKVYLKDSRSVIKLNKAIRYLSWADYFVNLLLHNCLFPDTAYNLFGFFEKKNVVYAVIEQPFVKATEKTDLSHVEQFMRSNGFLKIRSNNYCNPEFRVVLEKMHDKNVLTNNGILYFIDTAFYFE